MTESGPVRVMIVDDQPPFRVAVRAVVERLTGFEIVAEAASGEEAVAVAADLHPDLVLMDINMGEMNGIEATRRIVDADGDALVVLLSTYDLADLPPEARTSGAVAYVPKDDLGVRVVRTLWEQRGDPGFAA